VMAGPARRYVATYGRSRYNGKNRHWANCAGLHDRPPDARAIEGSGMQSEAAERIATEIYVILDG
jgi:hypothetical protein